MLSTFVSSYPSVDISFKLLLVWLLLVLLLGCELGDGLGLGLGVGTSGLLDILTVLLPDIPTAIPSSADVTSPLKEMSYN